MTYLLLALLALWTAPLVQAVTAGRKSARIIVNLVMPVGMCFLVVVDVLPYCYEMLGPWSLALGAGGLFVPVLAEWLWRRGRDARKASEVSAGRRSWAPLVPMTLAVTGLALHSAADGASFTGGATGVLSVLVVAHRFIEGVFIWVTISAQAGRRVALFALALDSSCTTLGYLFGGLLLSSMGGQAAMAGFQALVAGSLLHLVFHRHLPHDHNNASGHDGHAHGH